MTAPLRVLPVGDSDTRLKWAVACARLIGDDSGPVITLHSGNVPSGRQLSEIGVSADRHVVTGPSALFDSREVAEADVIVTSLYGKALAEVHRALTRLGATADRRPLLVVGYPGLVYENHVEGLCWRLGADIICANSRHDERLFKRVATELGHPDDSIVCVGYPQFAGNDARRQTARTDTFQLTFAVQPDVPRLRSEREYVLRRLVTHAATFPNREVVVKLRSRPGEWTSHAELHHYERLARRLAKRLGDLPPNIRFEYGHMADVLRDTDLLVTFSSTAALEAAAVEVPIAILTDFGVREPLGNHAFVGSGCLSTFDVLDRGEIPVVDEKWLEEIGVGHRGGVDRLRSRLEELVQTQAAMVGSLPVIPMHESVDRLAPSVGARARSSRLRRVVSSLLTGPLRDLNSRIQGWASQ